MAKHPPNRCVLLVEDDRPLNALVNLWLQQLGYSTRTAYDAAGALEQAQRGQPPGILLIDLHLGDADGEETARKLLPSLAPHALLISMSSNRDALQRSSLFSRMLGKPFARHSLKEALEATSPQALEAVASQGGVVLDTVTFARLQRSLAAEDLRDFYAKVLADAHLRVDAIENSLTRGDVRAAALDAHALRGACDMAGFAQMASLAADIEKNPEKESFDVLTFIKALAVAERMLKVHFDRT